jgi:hypothetical protein
MSRSELESPTAGTGPTRAKPAAADHGDGELSSHSPRRSASPSTGKFRLETEVAFSLGSASKPALLMRIVSSIATFWN